MDCFQAMRETHDLREEIRKLQRVCGLKNEEIEQEVNLRIVVSVHSYKSISRHHTTAFGK